MFKTKPKTRDPVGAIAADAIRINLLDWRENKREQRRRNFISSLALTILVCVAAVAGVTYYVLGSRIDVQQQRNDYLQEQIDLAKTKLVKLKKIKAERADLLRRMGIIEDLQQSRSWIVHYFDEVADTVPDGVYLTSLKQNGSTTTLTGVAESNARVSDYMVNLDNSAYLDDPRLVVIKSRNSSGHRYADFTLQVNNEHPANEPTTTTGAGQ